MLVDPVDFALWLHGAMTLQGPVPNGHDVKQHVHQEKLLGRFAMLSMQRQAETFSQAWLPITAGSQPYMGIESPGGGDSAFQGQCSRCR